MIHVFLLSLILAGGLVPPKSVSFVLRNNAEVSIPLEIPGFMNPNLSPNSNSSLTLDAGTEIYFRVNRKRYVLLTVDSTLDGDTLIVDALLMQRKLELGL